MELKFRAYNRHEKRMSYFSLETLIDGYGDDDVCTPDGEYVEPIGPTMLYTGLKDKDGVEIYEGDIISHPDSLDWAKTGKSVVEWLDQCASFAPFSDDGDNAPYYPIPAECKVIGNIYENKEIECSGTYTRIRRLNDQEVHTR